MTFWSPTEATSCEARCNVPGAPEREPSAPTELGRPEPRSGFRHRRATLRRDEPGSQPWRQGAVRRRGVRADVCVAGGFGCRRGRQSDVDGLQRRHRAAVHQHRRRSARGHVNNPLDSTANKLAPKSSGRNGPFAGDIAVYALKLFSNSALTRPAGSAVYTCYFNYDRHALCQAYYKLKAGGTLVASGPVDFKVSTFTIVVSGGTKKYSAPEARPTPSPPQRNAQKIDFELIG